MATEDDLLLQEICKLYERGEKDEAFELLNSLLKKAPDHLEARLLRAELCLKEGKEYEFIGQVASECYARLERSEREQALVDEVIARAKRELASARENLKERYVNRALDGLGRAVALMPWDASIWLAKALALIDFLHNQSEALLASDDEEAEGIPMWLFAPSMSDWRMRSSIPLDLLNNEIEKALVQARAIAAPGTLVWQEATLRLIEIHIGRVQPIQVMLLLAEAREAGLDADGRLAELQRHAVMSTLGEALRRARLMMQLGKVELAGDVVAASLQIAPYNNDGWLTAVEVLRLRGHVEQAIAICRWLSTDGAWAKGDAVPDLAAACKVLEQAQQIALGCPRCGGIFELTDSHCTVCGYTPPQDVLLQERLNLTNMATVPGVLAVMLEEMGGHEAEALEAAREAFSHLPQKHSARQIFDEMIARLELAQAARCHEEKLEEAIGTYRAGNLVAAREAFLKLASLSGDDGRALAWLTVIVARSKTLAETDRATIERAARLPAEIWAQVPLAERLRLLNTLLTAGWLMEARALLPSLFADNERSTRKVKALLSRCGKRITTRCDELAEEARHRLRAGQPGEAIWLTGQALMLDPLHIGALLVRAEAFCEIRALHSAAGVFRQVLDIVQANSPEQVQTVTGLARVYEMLGDLPEALRVLDQVEIPTPEVRRLREDLENRTERRPAVHVAADGQRFRAFFGVEVTAAARWHPNDRLALSRSEMLKAGLDFVSTLGGLAKALGYPAFALRFVSAPNPDVPSQGRLRIALLCRVTHSVPEGAEQLALELWKAISTHLPLEREHIYQYEPIYGEADLLSWLEPFEVRDGAEIVRVEEQEEEGYVVYPFTSGGTPLLRLADMLLHESDPALVSIHLQPTQFAATEREAFRRNVERLRRIRLPEDTEEEDDVTTDKLPAQFHLSDPERSEQVEMLTSMRQGLDKQPFLLRVITASAVLGNRMLHHAIAAEMFGPGGRYRVEQVTSEEHLETLCADLRGLEVNRQLAPNAPEALHRLRCLVGEVEAGLVFRLPMPGREGIPGLPTLDLKAVPPPRLPVEGVSLGESITTITGIPQMVRLRQEDRRRHLYIIGKTGVGKSTLIETMALQDMEAGRGVAVFDPHGDLVESLLTHIPPHRADDVILFDPSDEERPIGLNFLQAETDTQRHRITTEFVEMLTRMYDPHQLGIAGPLFQHTTRMGMLTAMLGIPGATLLDVLRVLTSDNYARSLLPNISDPLIHNFWEQEVSQWPDRYRGEVQTWVVAKFNRFVGDRRVRLIIGQSESTINFRSLMDERRILLVNLSKGKLGPESAQFLGFLTLQSLLIAALSRADQVKEERDDFCLYVDEFQTFATETFAAMLSEGRKYGLCLVMANQYLNQLPADLTRAVFGNVGSLVVFQVGIQDAEMLAPEFYPVYSADDLMNLPRYTAAARLLIDGVSTRPFPLRTRLVRHLPDYAQAARIREVSRLRYGRDAKTVLQEIEARFKAAA